MGSEASITVTFAAGVLSFLSPCVLPLAPAYLCFLAGVSISQARADAGPLRLDTSSVRIVLIALSFVLGFSTVFVALGATVSALGRTITAHFTLLSVIAGSVICLLGLHLLGLTPLRPLMRDIRFQATARPASLLGAYVVGLAFAFGWTPCVGPVLATVLLVAGAEDTAARGAILLAAYSAGIGLPFLLAAAFIGPCVRLVGRIGRRLVVVERVTGAGLVATGILIMTGAMPRLAELLLQAFPSLGTVG